MGLVQGKVAVVTGGASGIGAACARTLAREGAKVVVTDLDPAGEGVAAEFGGAFLKHDVADEAGWAEVVATAERHFGGLHVMVANAGIGIGKSILETTLADWRKQMSVNVEGVFLSVKFAIPAIAKSGGGSIVVISSVAGLRGAPGLACYGATKGAVRLFAKSAALECAQAQLKIRVNSVHPGIIETPIWGKLPTSGRNAPLDPRALAAQSVPLGEVGLPQDIANGVLYLASDLSSHVTGSELVIDGGMTAGRTRSIQQQQ